MIVDLLEDRARHIVDAMDEPPPGTEEQDAQTIRDMWSFSPYNERAPEAFWMLHGLALEKLLAEVAASGMTGKEKLEAIKQAHQRADHVALSRVYPHRATVMLLGVTTPERSVQLAERAQRLVEQWQRRGSAPERESVEVSGY